ncbi:BTB/POZ domain-containing protein 2-like isoform X2 [Paramacrobiotus metropolitanus]|uniref:BTB/POZ domain-containing protein 2-like isoform X2 n=1 Tax=Paramacrobiotus metropolitanus TaxID=2943436 RepID=UPI002445C910|nr:BTB/POZ domain-containing protein 2-like isoform X2 [Paramacrobiotus metropolitanus]
MLNIWCMIVLWLLWSSAWSLVDTYARNILPSKQFVAISQGTLGMILQRNSLSVDENTLYMVVEKWAAEACRKNNLDLSRVNRRQMLGDALFHIRFPLLSDSQLVNGPAKNDLLLESELLAVYKYKHAKKKPPLPFPVEPRKGVNRLSASFPDVPDFQHLDQVFASVEGENWHAGEIVEKASYGFLVKLKGHTVSLYQSNQLVRASDFLKRGQPILCSFRRMNHETSELCLQPHGPHWS